MPTDLEIANAAELSPISEIAQKLEIQDNELEPYGKYKAKINNLVYQRLDNKPDGKLILVTAINPTPAGEGKTTVTIGLGQAMSKIGKNTVIALREPSLGPVFGIKGGATGGGYSQVLPMEDINLHFTGDMHAITSANNLLCALLDNHLQQGNSLNINPKTILIKRCLDINDRALRNTVIGLGGKINGVTREDGFVITVATEIMAILCLAKDLGDLKTRLGNILVAYNFDGEAVYAKQLNAHGAMTVLLKEAIKPNLVQSLEKVPVIIHGGPFANIAHGCNSIRATKLALKLGDYCITEAGFGSDLGAEKFLDIKCTVANLKPSCIVVVATVRALKYNGKVEYQNLKEENLDALKKGLPNLGVHVENMKKYGVPVIVALNLFETDTSLEIEEIKKYCRNINCEFEVANVFAQGGLGATGLAKKVCDLCDIPSEFSPLYSVSSSIKDKIFTIASQIYRADGVIYTPEAEKSIKEIEKLGRSNLPVCIAKTQYSLSDDPTKLCYPKGFKITVRNVSLSNGAGFIVVLTGNIMTMPGLPKIPAAESIDIDENGKTCGIF